MAYNPGISYRGDQYISAGISDAANSVSKYFRDKRAEEDELEMQRGVLLGRYGSDGQFGGSEKLGEPAGAAGEPGYGGAPMNQADAGVAEQLGESAGAAGEPGASSGGIFGMFGRSNRPTAPAKTKATDSQTAESKGFRGLQAFASSEYNIPVEATTAMSKNALKGFLVGLDQRRTAEGQAQDRARQERQAQSADRLSDAQINNYASLDQDRVIRQLADTDQHQRNAMFDQAMQPTGTMPGLQQFAGMNGPASMAPGTLDSFASMPAQIVQPTREQIARAVLQFGPNGPRAEGAKMFLDATDANGKGGGEPREVVIGGVPYVYRPGSNDLQVRSDYLIGKNAEAKTSAEQTAAENKLIVTVQEIVNGVPVNRRLTASEFEAWKAENPDKATAGLQAKLKALRAAQAAGKKEIDLGQLMGGGGIDLSPWWGGKPIENGIKYLETMLGGGKAAAPAAEGDSVTMTNPKGQTVKVPKSRVGEAKKAGYK